MATRDDDTYDAHLEHLSQLMADQVRPLSHGVAARCYEAWSQSNVGQCETTAQAAFYRAVESQASPGSLSDLGAAWAVEWEARGFLAGFHIARQLMGGPR